MRLKGRTLDSPGQRPGIGDPPIPARPEGPRLLLLVIRCYGEFFWPEATSSGDCLHV